MNRRTNPGYLSDGEAAQERLRTSEVVEGITKEHHSKHDILSEKEVKSDWYVGKVCDSCGDKLWMMSWRCKKCGIHLCNKCAEEIKVIKNENNLCCPMCDEILK